MGLFGLVLDFEKALKKETTCIRMVDAKRLGDCLPYLSNPSIGKLDFPSVAETSNDMAQI